MVYDTHELNSEEHHHDTVFFNLQSASFLVFIHRLLTG